MKALCLHTYLVESMLYSRREAEQLILQGEITINHWPIKDPLYEIKEKDTVRHGKSIILKVDNKSFVYYVMNKPEGYITTVEDDKNRPIVLDLLGKTGKRLFPVGRLDIGTTGVLLLTNDGLLAEQLTHPRYEIQKVYQVTLNRDVSDDHIQLIGKGLFLKDGRVSVDNVIRSRQHSKVKITLHSGKNKIVRRIFESLGYTIRRLDRINFAGVTKKNLMAGESRFLTLGEVSHLKHLIS